MTLRRHAASRRDLAAFHLDKLHEAGLLTVDFERADGAGGPGSGRPPKRYRRADVEVQVQLPPREYELAARILVAAARASSPSGVLPPSIRAAARAEGQRLGRLRRKPTRAQAALQPCAPLAKPLRRWDISRPMSPDRSIWRTARSMRWCRPTVSWLRAERRVRQRHRHRLEGGRSGTGEFAEYRSPPRPRCRPVLCRRGTDPICIGEDARLAAFEFGERRRRPVAIDERMLIPAEQVQQQFLRRGGNCHRRFISLG